MFTGPVVLRGRPRAVSPNPKRLTLPVDNRARRRWRHTLCMIERVLKLDSLYHALHEHVSRFHGRRTVPQLTSVAHNDEEALEYLDTPSSNSTTAPEYTFY